MKDLENRPLGQRRFDPDGPGHKDPHDHDHPGHDGSNGAPEGMDDPKSRALSEALSSSFVIVKVAMVLLVVVFFASGVFTVPSQEQAIILRFGKPVGVGEQQLLESGLHWSWPYPIDEVVRIPITRLQSVSSTVGWYATTPEWELTNSEPSPGESLNPAIDGYVLTADGNIIHVRGTLSYRINNPLQYALNFVNASNVVQSALDNALIHVTPEFPVDDALRLQVNRFRERVRDRVRRTVEEQNFGISVEDVTVRTIPPRQTREAFEEFFAAEQERQKAISEAQGYANNIIARAQGESAAIVNAGETDSTRLVQALGAEARVFENQLPHYRRNPELFVARLQTETLQRVMTNVQDKIWVPTRADGKPRELRLQLSREPRRPSQPPAAGQQ